MRKVLAALALLVAVGSCTSNGSPTPSGRPTADSPTVSPSATASPTPVKPPEPSLKDTRLEGLYAGPVTVLTTNVNYGNDSLNGRAEWEFTPRCGQGACDVLLVSRSGRFKVRLALVGARYVGQVRRNNAYTCGDDFTNDANENIRLTPLASRYIDDEWLIVKLKGLLVYDQITTNGTCTSAHERFAITLKRSIR